jgi:hypothetical protein
MIEARLQRETSTKHVVSESGAHIRVARTGVVYPDKATGGVAHAGGLRLSQQLLYSANERKLASFIFSAALQGPPPQLPQTRGRSSLPHPIPTNLAVPRGRTSSRVAAGAGA